MLHTARPFFLSSDPFEFFQQLTRQTCESMVQISTLNVQTTQAALGTQTQHWTKLLQVQRPDELSALQADVVQPLASQASQYGQQLYQIANDLGQAWQVQPKAGLGDLSSQWERMQSNMDKMLKNLPVTAQALSASVKNRLASANEAVSAIQQVVTQANNATQANLLAAVESTTHPETA